ncbi:MAG: SDR family oxidoreductase [Desulfobacterota bacterium]|nr:SDR family oxidoreductase [Thermodesulfobacteriota bacterium]
MHSNGLCALVTGASMGIGKAIAFILAEQGYAVVCAARTTAKVEDTAAQIKEKGGRAIAVTADVARINDVQRMVDEAIRAFGTINVLINNAGGPLAGVLSPSPKSQDEFFSLMQRFMFSTVSDADWKKIFETNFFGVYNCTRAVLPIMLENNSGTIINITSKAGKIKTPVVPGMSAYATAKAAVARFTEVLAFELSCMGSAVRINAISPGMVAVSYHENLPPEERAMFRKPEEIQDILLRILNDASINGEVFSSETMTTWYQELREGNE